MATSSSNARRRQTPDQPASADTSPQRPRKSSKLKRFLRLLLLVLIVIAASVGATLYYTWPAGASLFSFVPNTPAPAVEAEVRTTETILVESPPEPISTIPIFVRLDPFTVTVSEGGARTRILHVAITLRVANNASTQIIEEYMPMVRDRVLKILSEQHPQFIQTPEGREQLVATLNHSLSQPFDAKSTADITHVLFTAFVIQ